MARAGKGPTLQSSKGTLLPSPWAILTIQGPLGNRPNHSPGQPREGLNAFNIAWGGLPPGTSLQILAGA